MAHELLNLVEMAKGMTNPVSSGMVQTFADESDVSQVIPFKPADQGMNVFDRETAEPAVGFRALNDTPDISHGEEEEFQDSCYPISGLIEFDRIKLKRYGQRKRALYMAGQMKSASRLWTETFIHGDNSTNPREFSGLQSRLTADATGSVNGTVDESRLLANTAAAGGAPLSLGNLDLITDLTAKPTHLLCSRRLRTRFKAAARDPNLTNNRITDDYDSQLGRRVLRFGDTPFLIGYEPSRASIFLPYNEVANGGGAAVTCSIYAVSFREDGVCGIQTSEPEFLPVDTETGVFKRDLFEWDNGITIEDPYSAMRLSSISDAAIVA